MPPKTKRIDGATWRLNSVQDRKAWAQEQSDFARENGWKARVVKFKDKGRTRYAVYVRR